MKTLENILEWGGTKRKILFLLLSGLALLAGIVHIAPFGLDLIWIAIILCGVPIVLEAMIGLITAFDIKADVLVSIALIASLIIGEYFAAGEIAFIMQLGALLEDITVAKAQAGIEKLVHLTPQTARVLRNEKESVIPAEQVAVGDVLRVLPGEAIPVDGLIISGQTSINQSVMTGESMPVDKSVGDEVYSGTVNQFGTFEMKAVKVGEDSSIQRMIRLVQSADAGKAKIVGIADRWATWIVAAALAFAILAWIVTGEVIRSVTVLVVFCPCALVLATPTAIMAAIGNAAKHGFLVKEGDALERLARVKKIAFDKTGTLTCGTPSVVAVETYSGYSRSDLLSLAAAAEQFSEHPLGKAIGKDCPGHLPPAADFQMFPGKGVAATVFGKRIKAGNLQFIFGENEPAMADAAPISASKYLNEGATVIYISADDVFAGIVVLSDTLRKESSPMIRSLSQMDVCPVLLTGDNDSAAKTIAGQLNIREVFANCLPEDKLDYIEHTQTAASPVCMIGDGVNDAPALKKAFVGIAMGGVGSDIAVDAADIALIDDDVRKLPHLIALSRRMMKTIKINLSFSMGLNFLAIILALTGVLNPIVGALVHNAGSVLVIINSALLAFYRS